MNFFEKKTLAPDSSQDPYSNRGSNKGTNRGPKKLFEFEGKYELENKPRYSDDNLNFAI